MGTPGPNGFNGFDIPKIRTLAGDLGKKGDSALTLHTRLSKILTDAQLNLAGKPATTSHLLSPLVDQVFFLPFGSPANLPGSLSSELHDMSGSMKRRCTQLEGLKKLEDKGYKVDWSLAFSDEKAPDPQKVQDALKYFKDHIDDSGGFLWSNPAQGADEVLKNFEKLSPTELDAVINKLSDAQLKKLNAQLGEGSSWWGAGDSDKNVKLRWANLLLSKVGPDALAKVEKDLTILEPDLHTQYAKNLRYQMQFGSLFGPGGVDIEHDLSQGEDGDCWFLASIGSIAIQDPGFFRRHIHQNPNGTYTVTFYRSPWGLKDVQGTPVKITVDGRLPVNSNGDPAYAHTPDNVMWVAIYEKAYAQFKGGYEKIDGGWGDIGLHDLTGQPTKRIDAKDLSLTEIKHRMAAGDAVTSGTKTDDDLGVKEFADNDKVVTSHEYAVKSVDTNAHPPTITLINPWGTGGVDVKTGKPVPQEITLTEDEYHKYFREVGITNTKV